MYQLLTKPFLGFFKAGSVISNVRMDRMAKTVGRDANARMEDCATTYRELARVRLDGGEPCKNIFRIYIYF